MEIQLKERLVGVMVLIALGIIFLPSLFHRDQRVEVDTTSLIPSKPQAEPIIIKRPQKTELAPAPKADQAFQPPVVEQPVETKPEPVVAPNTKKPSAPAKASLNKEGLPNAWVVQLGSFQSQKRARELTDQLLSKDYKAYMKPLTTAKGQFYRVFVGPYIDKSRAQSIKTTLDKAHKVDSRILKFSPQ